MADKERIKDLLSETIILLCKNGLNFDSEFSIEGLIGITVDKKDVFLVSLKETISSVNSIEETLQRRSPSSKNSVENADNSGGIGQKTQNAKTMSNKMNSSGVSDQSTRRRKPSCDASASEIDSENTLCKRSRASNVEVKLESDKRVDSGDTTSRKNQESNKMKDVDIQAMEMVNSIELFATLSKQSEHQHGQTTSTNIPFDDINTKVEENNQIGDVIKIESISDEDSSDSKGREQFESDWPGEMFSSSFATTSDDAAHSSFPTNSFSSNKAKTDTIHWLSSQPENRDGSSMIQQKDSGSFYTFSNPSIEINTEATWWPTAGQKARTSQTSSATAGSSSKPQNQVVYKYDCPYCDMRFSRTNNLRGHLVKHTGIKEFICSLCGKEYAYKQCLKEHLHIYHDVVMT